MMELRANYNFQMQQFANDKLYDKKMLDEEKELEELKQKVLKGPSSQRFAFSILDQHKKAALENKRMSALRRFESARRGGVT